MTRAIIFDCFGVLTTEAWLPFKAKYFGDSPGLYEEATQASWKADVGEISYDDFIKKVARLADITPQAAHLAIARNVPNEELFNYIDELKHDFKIGLLSNVVSGYLEKLFSTDQLARFDNISISFDSGVRKPDQQAYEIAAKGLGVKTHECVFIDDQDRNVVGAQRTGMTTVLYKNVKQLRSDLSQILNT
ncbi:MAG TPA: HAD family phosphatase [Candidatus Saccharimonadales bacterium]|nr:HAD family phosphatase [Candidatus Saccharimonadales bacterium]